MPSRKVNIELQMKQMQRHRKNRETTAAAGQSTHVVKARKEKKTTRSNSSSRARKTDSSVLKTKKSPAKTVHDGDGSNARLGAWIKRKIGHNNGTARIQQTKIRTRTAILRGIPHGCNRSTDNNSDRSLQSQRTDSTQDLSNSSSHSTNSNGNSNWSPRQALSRLTSEVANRVVPSSVPSIGDTARRPAPRCNLAVRFRPQTELVAVRTIPRLDTYSDDEWASCFYSRSEFDAITRKAYKVVAKYTKQYHKTNHTKRSADTNAHSLDYDDGIPSTDPSSLFVCTNSSNNKKLCIRGLEKFFTQRQNQVQAIRNKAVDVVMDIQEEQWQWGRDDEEQIAHKYHLCTRHCLIQAQERAKQDRMSIQKYVKRTDKVQASSTVRAATPVHCCADHRDKHADSPVPSTASNTSRSDHQDSTTSVPSALSSPVGTVAVATAPEEPNPSEPAFEATSDSDTASNEDGSEGHDDDDDDFGDEEEINAAIAAAVAAFGGGCSAVGSVLSSGSGGIGVPSNKETPLSVTSARSSGSSLGSRTSGLRDGMTIDTLQPRRFPRQTRLMAAKRRLSCQIESFDPKQLSDKHTRRTGTNNAVITVTAVAATVPVTTIVTTEGTGNSGGNKCSPPFDRDCCDGQGW